MEMLATSFAVTSGTLMGLLIFVVITSLPELRQWLLKKGYNQAFQEVDRRQADTERQVELLRRRVSELERTLRGHLARHSINDIQKYIEARFGDGVDKRKA